ncbi:hypothetical protein ACQ4PT_036061 [Festuca glaucescens]
MKINNLRLQTSCLLSMFELFGEEQKSLLNRYCIDAQSSEMNQVTSIPAANDEHRSCVAKEAHQTVELGVGKETGEQQERIVEEYCKKKSDVVAKKKKKKHKVSNKTDSIGDQQLEEVHPDPEHHTGSLPEILNPGNPHIQESNKELAIQMSGKKDVEADRPELGTSAATITEISAHKLAESLDPKATGEQQARIVEENCKKKSNVVERRRRKNTKFQKKTDSIGDQQLEEVHPDPEHHTGSLPEILNPGNPHIQESNKELAIQMSGKKDAEADRPELGTSAATITEISAHKLAESLDPKAIDEQQASIGEQQLKETPLLQSIPLDLFHIPKNPLRNQPFKRLDAETSNVIAEADAPDLETSAATINETSADMLVESLDPNDCKTSTGSDDAGCDISVVATIVGEPSTAVGPEDGQMLEDGQHIGKYPSILETTQTGPSELMFEESGDAKPKEMLVIMEGPCAISDQNANDALIKDVSDEGTEEENELAPTGDNTADEQEETNIVSWHHEQKQQINKETSGVQSESKENNNIAIEEEAIVDVTAIEDNPDNCSPEFATEPTMTTQNQKFIQYGDTEVTIGELADSFEDGAPIKTNIMTIMVDVARSIMTNTKRLIVPFMAVLRCNRIQRNNDGNVNTRKLGNLVKAINPVDDSLLLGRYEIIKIPCFKEGYKDDPVGHYFMMAVNLRRKRFELLDSLGGEGAEQHFVNMAEVFKEIWKEAYKQSEGKLSPENLDDFTYEKPKVIPLQGDTKRLLYLILMWEQLEVNIGLIETLHKDDFIKINSGEYKIIRKQTTVKPTMTIIVSLPDVNIPKPKEIDDGKENYPEEQEYVLISSQEDYSMECLKGRGRGEDDSKKHLDGNCQPEETTKNGKEDRNQQQQKPVVARNNEDSSIEYLRAREAKVDDPSRNSKEKGPPMIQTNAGPKRLNVVLFTPPNRKSSPPGYKVEKDMYSSLTGSQSFQTPPKDSKSNSVDVQHKDNLNRGKRKHVSPSDVMSTKRPKLTARKLCEPVAEYRPKKFKNQVKANKLVNLLVRSNRFAKTVVFNAPVMHSAVDDMKVPITGTDIKRQFSSGEFLDGGTMDYIIDEMKTTSELYDTGERVLLSQGFIMIEAMQYSRRSTSSRTQEPAPANLLVYHRRSSRERELADERNRAFREQEAVGGLEQLGECLVRTAIMALPSPNAPPHIRRACRPSMPSMAELPRRVDGLHPREARNQHICAGEYPPLEHLERALEGQYLHALIPPKTEKEVTASIVL